MKVLVPYKDKEWKLQEIIIPLKQLNVGILASKKALLYHLLTSILRKYESPLI